MYIYIHIYITYIYTYIYINIYIYIHIYIYVFQAPNESYIDTYMCMHIFDDSVIAFKALELD